MTRVPGLYVAGDVAGVEEASAAMVEGNLVGLAAAARLGYGGREAERRRAAYLEELRELRCGPMGQKIRDGICRLAG